MKILGDPHLGRQFVNNVPLHRRGERERMQRDKFVADLDPRGNPLHVCMGDLFDKAHVSYDVIFNAALAYRQAAFSHSDTTFVVLRGNHDASRDLEAVSAYDLFFEMTRGLKNLIVLKDPMILDNMAFFPWSPTVSAEDLVKLVVAKGGATAFGHWDVDLRSDPFNLIPTKTLAERGFTKAYTGHVHLPQQFERDGVQVTVTGSMLPYAHGEDPTGETYVTMSLAEARDADPEGLRNKCVRIKLLSDEIYDLNLDCLQLQVERVESESEEQLEVSLGEFDLLKLRDDALSEHGVPESISLQVRSEWDRRFSLAR